MGKIADDIIIQIPEIYKECRNKSEVARRLGIASCTVSKYLKLYEASGGDINAMLGKQVQTQTQTPPKERKERVTVTEELEQEINNRFSLYKNMAQVARELNVSNTTVKNHLNEENLALLKKQYDDRDALFFYIVRLFGPYSEDQPVSDHNLVLMNRYRQQGMPYQGQLLTLKYHYEVTHHKVTKEYTTIGIIPFIYERARQYYLTQANRAAEINRAIQKQLEQDRIELKYNPSDYFGGRRKKKKKLIDLDSLKE